MTRLRDIDSETWIWYPSKIIDWPYLDELEDDIKKLQQSLKYTTFMQFNWDENIQTTTSS